MKRLKTKLDIIFFIALVKRSTDEELKALVNEYKTGQYEII